MIKLQHYLGQLEREMSSHLQFKEIKNWQNFHGKSLSNLETELKSLKLSTKNLEHSVEEQRRQTKTTKEKQLQLREDLTKCSEDLLNLHAVYAKHFTYPQAFVDKAKDELKLHFEVERGNIFERLYEEKLHNLHEMLEIHLTKYGSSKEVKCNSSNKLSSETRLTKKVLVQIINDLKRSIKQWIMTSKSTLYFLRGLIHHQDSEIVNFRMWTVRHIHLKLKHTEEFIEALNVQLRSNKQEIMVLNESINAMKSLCFSYPSLAYMYGRTCTMKRKCKKEMRRKENLELINDGYSGLWNILLITILLLPIIWIYFPWASWSNSSFEDIRKWMKKSFKFCNEMGPGPTKPVYKEKLENSLCVISFGCGTDKQKYVQLASDLIGPVCHLQMKNVVVNSIENLDTIPPSKVILMFVDYNERNLIIEEEHGGLKRETLSMLQRTGAEVIVIYCYELSSKHLDGGRLFAQKLTVVERIKELRELRERNSIFSIYDKFNPTQKEVFRSKLNYFN
ncbi:uncharacterized protein LOC133192759 [Saccostrea echinata]|uniref:uncharacterized protein LOC133192759 n=1 Tax=Saccostrea echinata TaxID=191078 RepID=UPI002A8213C3|nr:uncharacterized protein LOC133192759 [Saccostrea echinata]